MLDDVIQIARAAGAVILRHYGGLPGHDLEVTRKDDASPLTVADRESNLLIVERLAALTPDVPVVAEESPLPPYEERRSWRRFWLVDPLDGTKEFLKRNGEFTVNVALIDEGVPVLGVLLAPALDLLYFAERGQGAWKAEGRGPPRRIHSRPPVTSGPLAVLTSRSHAGPEDAKALLPGRQVAREVHLGSALKFGFLAEGKADVYLRRSPTMEWDVAAGDCLWRNSARTGLRSSPLRYNKPTLTNPEFVLGLEP